MCKDCGCTIAGQENHHHHHHDEHEHGLVHDHDHPHDSAHHQAAHETLNHNPQLNDAKTMQLVPTEVNAKFTHLGGVGEINAGAYAPGGFAAQ